jgi:thiaminase
MIDEAAINADAETKSLMNQYFLKAALYEYAFWDYGYYADTKSYDYTNSLTEWI